MNELNQKAVGAGLCLLVFAWGIPPASAAEAPPAEPETAATPDPGGRAAIPAAYEYETEVQRLETDGGAYDPQLGEQLLSLGLVYQAQEQHEDAVKALKRAMYIKRVNDGLYDMAQVPILNEIIESNIASQNWEDLDQAYEQLLFIHRRNFEPGDPRFLPILDQVGAWKVKAYTEGLLKELPMTTINAAEKLYKDNVKLLTKQYGETDPRLIDPLYGRAVVSYQLLREAASRPLHEYRSTAAAGRFAVRYQTICRTIGLRSVCTTIPVADNAGYVSELSMQQQEKDMEMQKFLTITGDSLKRIVEIHDAHPELPAESRAQALVHFGDWNLLRNRRSTAIDYYKRAYQTLAANDAESDKLLEKYFGSPKSIPALRLPAPQVERKLDEVADPSYVMVAVDISKRGEARNFRVVEQSDPANASAARQAREKIREGRFRPRFENGEPVETPGFQLRVTDRTE
jgi:tetratricopeptide (TPR) repeat protein